MNNFRVMVKGGTRYGANERVGKKSLIAEQIYNDIKQARDDINAQIDAGTLERSRKHSALDKASKAIAHAAYKELKAEYKNVDTLKKSIAYIRKRLIDAGLVSDLLTLDTDITPAQSKLLTVGTLIEKHPKYKAELMALIECKPSLLNVAKKALEDAAEADGNELALKRFLSLHTMHTVLRQLDISALDERMARAAKTQSKAKTKARPRKAKGVINFNIKHADLKRVVADNQDSEDWKALMVVCAIACGRRSTEILMTGQFERVSNTSMMFTGQLKKRGFDMPAIELPLQFLSYDQFIAVINRLRNHAHVKSIVSKAKTSIDPNASLAGYVRDNPSKRARELLQLEGESGFTFHTLRDVYIRLCLDQMDSKHEAGAASTLLGHSKDGGGSAANTYLDISVDYDAKPTKAAPPKPKAAYIRNIDGSLRDYLDLIEVSVPWGWANVPALLDELAASKPSMNKLRPHFAKVARWLSENPDKRVNYSATKRHCGGTAATNKLLAEVLSDYYDNYNKKLDK